MLFLYRLSLFLYSLTVRVASLFNPKAKLFIEGRKDLLLQIKAAMGKEQRPRIWMHCASLGEFEQGRPVLEYLRQQYPDHAIILTFFSPSGYQVRKKYKGADYIFYLPLDTRSNARQFILNTSPSLAIFIKYDLWYFYLQALQQQQIPSVLLSAIFSPRQGYFKWYGGIQREMLRMLSCIFVQDERSRDMLTQIGITHAIVAGDTRFDRVIEAAAAPRSLDQMQRLSQQYPLLIAGSTWKEDEELLHQVCDILPENWKLVIVPHEVDEERISSIERLFKGKVRRWSEWSGENLFPEQVLIVDTIGLLLKIYSYGRVAWIGGGLSSSGVHNVLEAAVYGLPCAYGPEYEDYIEAVELIEAGGAVSCANAASLSVILQRWTTDPHICTQVATAARSYVQAHAGATRIITGYLAEKNWLRTL